MSLIEPTFYERLPVWVRAVILLGIALLIIGGILFGVDRIGNWKRTRKIDKARAEVANSLANLANAQSNLAVDKALEAERVEDVKKAANTLIEAANASEGARIATNEALANLSRAVNANVPVGTTAEDIERQLKELGQ